MESRTLCAEEFPRDIESLSSHHHNFLAIEQLLSYCASQATQKMSLAVDNDLVRGESV